MDFARNPAQAEALHSLVQGQAPSDGAGLWALVDTAVLDRHELDRLARALGWTLFNALAGSPLEVYGSHAPVWIELSPPSSTTVQDLTRLLALDAAAPALSLVRTQHGLDALRSLSAYLSRARIDGDMLTHCRFADTRVLPVLLKTLAASQQHRVAHAVQSWGWIDQLGQGMQWHAAQQDTTVLHVDGSEFLELDASQFAAMLDASEPDTMFALLCDNTPELVPAEGRGDFRELLAAVLGRADQRQLTAANDRLQFIVLSLSCGGHFHDAAELQDMWCEIAQGQTTLVESMKRWSDTLWSRLQSSPPGGVP